MTVRTWLVGQVRLLMEEAAVPPPPSPVSTPPITTPSTPNGTSTEILRAMELLEQMHRESMKEMRELVVDLTQGRVQTNGTPPADWQEVDKTFLPPDYDSDKIPLSEGIQAVFDREMREDEATRLLRTEQETLAWQLNEARRQLLEDPQGLDSETS